MPFDPHFLSAIQAPAFFDFPLPCGDPIRIHRPCLGHILELHALATPMVSDGLTGEDGWNYSTTVAALAVLMSKPGNPEQIRARAVKKYPAADLALSQGFGPWVDPVEEDDWGNPDSDAFIAALRVQVLVHCQPPEIISHQGAKACKTPWPLQLVSRMLNAGWSEKTAWKTSPALAFWYGEAGSETAGRGSSIVPLEMKIGTARALRESAESAIK